MSLRPGTRLGLRETPGMRGKGGMGEVYSTNDTRLERGLTAPRSPKDRAPGTTGP